MSLSMDNAAYQDFVVHYHDSPVSVDALRKRVHGMNWYETVTEGEWPALHDVYVESFGKYQHDAEAIGYRETRKARERSATARERSRR